MENLESQIKKVTEDENPADMEYLPFEGGEGNKADATGFGKKKSCSNCKKKFLVSHPTIYAYKFHRYGRNYFFCCWSCMCQYRRKKGL